MPLDRIAHWNREPSPPCPDCFRSRSPWPPTTGGVSRRLSASPSRWPAATARREGVGHAPAAVEPDRTCGHGGDAVRVRARGQKRAARPFARESQTCHAVATHRPARGAGVSPIPACSGPSPASHDRARRLHWSTVLASSALQPVDCATYPCRDDLASSVDAAPDRLVAPAASQLAEPAVCVWQASSDLSRHRPRARLDSGCREKSRVGRRQACGPFITSVELRAAVGTPRSG